MRNYIEMSIDGNSHRIDIGDEFFDLDYQKLIIGMIEVIIESDAHKFDLEDIV
tara:strand:- start:899 stop:1057 length:159 start_codon:yes stop_codon:yes gene_type:complete